MYIPTLTAKTKKIIGVSSIVAALLLIVGLASYTNLLDKLTNIFGSRAASAPIVLDTKNDFLGVSLSPEALSFYRSEYVTVDDVEASYLQIESTEGQDGYITVDASLFGNFTGAGNENTDPNATEGLGGLLGKEKDKDLPTDNPPQSQMPIMQYSSPALALEGEKNNFTGFSAIDYSANSLFNIQYAYRQADTLVELAEAEYLSIDLGSGLQLDGSELIFKELAFGVEVGKYIQLQVTFSRNGTAAPAYAPAVYQMQILSESLDTTDPISDELEDGNVVTRQVVINYAAVNAPKDAELSVYAADVSGEVISTRNHEDLSTRTSVTVGELALEDGKQYMLAVKSPEVLEKLVQFTVLENINIYQFNLTNFTLLPEAGMGDGTITERRVVDVNGDGKINLADLSLFMQLYGTQAEGGVPVDN